MAFISSFVEASQAYAYACQYVYPANVGGMKYDLDFTRGCYFQPKTWKLMHASAVLVHVSAVLVHVSAVSVHVSAMSMHAGAVLVHPEAPYLSKTVKNLTCFLTDVKILSGFQLDSTQKFVKNC